MSTILSEVLEVAAVVIAGTMTGNELAVALIVHPRISRLDDATHLRTAQTLARALGIVMPFWYALTFLLSLTLTLIVHTAWTASRWLALAATALYLLIILYSILLPVPINNQIARCQPDAPPANWRALRRRWDTLHAIRVVFLLISLIFLVTSTIT